MNIILSTGILIFFAFILGELAELIKLPKISGYIHADILLNPDLFNIVTEGFVKNTVPLLTISLSGLHLQLSSISGSAIIIAIFVFARGIGKYTVIYSGSVALKTDRKIKKYAAGGLIPQGGIVIGMALLLAKEQAFSEVSSIIIGVVIGAALIHEIIGPVTSRYSLKKAGEIEK
ncbi:MAG: hypothetical protein ACOCWA_09345 [Bacteroidota bacterium]